MSRIFIIAALVATVGLILFFSGVNVKATLLTVSGLGLLFWWFTRKSPPQGEMPCNNVCCVHYLGNREEEHVP